MTDARDSVRRLTRRAALHLVVLPAVAALSAAAVAYACAAPAPPALDYPPVVDLGDRPFGEVAVGRFVVTNAGRSPLRLTQFATSCSCAGVEHDAGDGPRRIDAVEVAPGGGVALSVRVSAGAIVGTRQDVSVAFVSNDPAKPVGVIRVFIPQVTGGVHAEPAVAEFGEVPVGTTPTRVVRLFDNGIPGRRVASVRSLNPDRFDARLVPAGADEAPPGYPAAGDLIGRVEITPRTISPGPLRGQVEVQVTDGGVRPDRIDVFGEVVGPARCRPDALVLPRVVAGKPSFEGETRVTWQGGRPDRVTVAAAPDGVRVDVRYESDAAVVTVRGDGRAASGPARLSVRGREGPGATVDLPVTVSGPTP